MLKIRLQRVGRKHEPVFRVVLTDSKNGPKSGKFIEILGSYDARDKNDTQLKTDRINYWIEQGAQPSDTLHNLLVQKEIIKGEKRNVLPKKSPIKKDEEDAPAKEAPKEESPVVEGETAPEASVEEAPVEEKKEDEAPKEEEKPVEEVKEKVTTKEEEKKEEEEK